MIRWAGGTVAPNAKICSNTRFYGSNVVVGEDAWIGVECVVVSSSEAQVQIGARCDVGPGVWFITGSHIIGDGRRRAGEGESKPISIGAGTWIGARATILGGVSIGTGTVIAAGAVVLPGCYDADVLLAGVPAKVKRHWALCAGEATEPSDCKTS